MNIKMSTGQPKGRQQRYDIVPPDPELKRRVSELEKQQAFNSGRDQGAWDACLSVVTTYICCCLLAGRALG